MTTPPSHAAPSRRPPSVHHRVDQELTQPIRLPPRRAVSSNRHAHLTLPALLLSGLVLMVMWIVAAGVGSEGGSGTGSSASASSTSSTTPLGCDVPDLDSDASSERWIDCTERELADRLCDTYIGDITAERSGDVGSVLVSSYVDYSGSAIRSVNFQYGTEPGVLVNCGSSHRISEADAAALVRAGDESDLSAALRSS